MVSVHPQSQARLNVLLTEDRPHAPEHWTVQLSRLLQPQGVAAYMARSGREAIDLAEQVTIHAAVIDLSTPLDGNGFAPASSTGIWLLELMRRLPYRPPVVVVRGPAISQNDFDRMMREALRLGAFSVMNKPIDVEQVLAVFRRLLDRRYRGMWPSS